ncbi:MAG: NAD-dependent epimerase/dehydratase family protein [Xanthobacteraceae bacterium]
MARILVLGAAGRIGYAAAEAFRDAGWNVASFVRPGAGARAPADTEIVESVERSAVVAAARAADVVLHALNVPYPQWRAAALPLTYVAIEAAEAAGATLLFPGNVYNFGAGMPEVLDENTPIRPTSGKGRIREAMELRMREAADRGMRAIVLRAGDVFGGGRGTWFDLVIARDVNRGRVTYPGPLDAVHAWAYLPDLATAMVRLADRRATLGALETFGFPGHAVPGREMIHAMARAMQRDLRVKRMRWWMVKTVGQLFAMGRELAEIEYLWRVPHRISGEKLKSLIGELPHTPLDQAVAAALRKLGYSRSAQ